MYFVTRNGEQNTMNKKSEYSKKYPTLTKAHKRISYLENKVTNDYKKVKVKYELLRMKCEDIEKALKVANETIEQLRKGRR